MRTATSRAVAAGIAGAVALATVGCGGDGPAPNQPRPPARIVLTASISTDRVSVSPARFGAGPISLVVANLTDTPSAITLETADAAGRGSAGRRRSTRATPPSCAPTCATGRYTVHVATGGIRAATLRVGRRAAERPERPVAAVDAPGRACHDRGMRARWLLAALALALPAAAAAQAAPPEQTTPPQQTPQALFTGLIVNDPRTERRRPRPADLRRRLRRIAAAVRRPHRRRAHGRGRAGADPGRRRGPSPSTRSRPTGRATAACAPSSAARRCTGRRWRSPPPRSSSRCRSTRTGDDVCCPAERAERRYGWDARAKRMRRR